MNYTRHAACALAIAISALALTPRISSADDLIDYSPFSSYRLGVGFYASDFTHPLVPCVETDASHIGHTNASQTNTTYSLTYSSDDYERALHIDQRAKASFLDLVSADESMRYSESTKRSGSAFAVIINVSAERPTDDLNNPTLLADYRYIKTETDPKRIEDFRQRCGDRLITTQFNDARVFAVLHVSATQNSRLLEFAAHGQAQFDLDIASIDASIGGDQTIKEAHQEGALTVTIFTEGLNGLSETPDLMGIRPGMGLDEMQKVMNNWLTDLLKNGDPAPQPVRFRLTSMPWLPPRALSDDRITNDLATMRQAYIANIERLENINRLRTTDPRRDVLIEPDADQQLADLAVKVKAHIDDIKSAHGACTKAYSVDECAKGLTSVQIEPAPISAEAPLVTAPVPLPFFFVFDGVSYTPSATQMMTAIGPRSVFDQANQVKPNTANVDLLAGYSSYYLASADLKYYSGEVFPDTPKVVGGVTVTARSLNPPAYAPKEFADARVMTVLHADAVHPCPRTLSTEPGLAQQGALIPDASCLTPQAKLWLEIARAHLPEVVFHAHRPPAPQAWAYPLDVAGSDCWQNTATHQVGLERVGVRAGPSNTIIATATIFVNALGTSYPIAEITETHYWQEWLAMRDARGAKMASLVTPTADGFDPCTPHIGGKITTVVLY